MMSDRGVSPPALLGAVAGPLIPALAPSGVTAVALPCRSCGAPLVRIGAFYWHAVPQARCPVTSWPASSVERSPAAPPAALVGRTQSLDEGALTMSKRGGNKTKRPPKAPMTNRGPKPK